MVVYGSSALLKGLISPTFPGNWHKKWYERTGHFQPPFPAFSRLLHLPHMQLVTKAGVLPAASITVFPNSIKFMKMDALLDADWQDEFTREEMLEQQSRLLTEECHLLKKELSR